MKQPTKCNICGSHMVPINYVMTGGFTVICPNKQCPKEYVSYKGICSTCKQPRKKDGSCTLPACPSDWP